MSALEEPVDCVADDEAVEALPEAEEPPDVAAEESVVVAVAVAKVEALEVEDLGSCAAAWHQEVCSFVAANLFGSEGQLL
jgi:hypothetical protein